MLLPNIPLIFRRRRGRATKKRADAPAPPAALVLVEAELVSTEPAVLRLEFDRAIDAGALDAPQIVVQYPSGSGFEYVGDAVADLPEPQIVDIAMAENGPAQGAQDVLNATSATGIVAVDDGAAWAGVTDLGLPYP